MRLPVTLNDGILCDECGWNTDTEWIDEGVDKQEAVATCDNCGKYKDC